MRILVTDGMDKTAMAQLREAGHEVVEQFYEPDQLGAALKEFDAVVVRSKTKVRANHIDEAKGGKLKLIIRGGVGVDNIDVKYAEANGIAVKNTPRASSQSVAELAMGHMFACARYISDEKVQQRRDTADRLAREFGAEGIIYEQMKYCDYWGFERALVSHIMAEEKNWPVLSVDRLYNNGNSGQLRTRVQAFVESLEIKRIRKEGGEN